MIILWKANNNVGSIQTSAPFWQHENAQNSWIALALWSLHATVFASFCATRCNRIAHILTWCISMESCITHKFLLPFAQGPCYRLCTWGLIVDAVLQKAYHPNWTTKERCVYMRFCDTKSNILLILRHHQQDHHFKIQHDDDHHGVQGVITCSKQGVPLQKMNEAKTIFPKFHTVVQQWKPSGWRTTAETENDFNNGFLIPKSISLCIHTCFHPC